MGNLGRVVTGKTPSTASPENFGSDYPFLTPTDMHGCKWARRTERGLSNTGALILRGQVPAGAVAISCIGWQMGKAILTDRPTYTNQQINTIIPNQSFDAEYLYYYFATRRGELLSIGSAGGVRTPIISKSSFEALDVEVPDLCVQRDVASVLSAYDDLIENNTRRIAILEEMARRIYEEWFVRFRFPGHEGVRMVESELGLVPEGWQAGTVADFAVVHRGRSYKGSELANSGGRPFVNLKCMERDGGFRASGLKRYTGQFKDSHTVRSGDMVMGITDMTQERRIVARVGRVSGLDADFGVFSMDLVRIASRGQYPEPYLFAMLRWSRFADEVKQHANGANVLHLLPARIEEFAFARPEPELAARFADLLAPMLSLCDTLERKNVNLRTTRDLLLPRLISGELDVSAMSGPEALAA